MAVIGMDIEAGRNLATLLHSDSTEITSLTSKLTQVLSNTEWYGNDANKFRSDWDAVYSRQLLQVAEALQHASDILNQQATDQENASS